MNHQVLLKPGEKNFCSDDSNKNIKGRANIQEAVHRLFRDWHMDRGVRFTDMWGNVAPGGAKTNAASITVPLSDGKYYTVNDLQKGCITYFESDPAFRKKKRRVLRIDTGSPERR